jgi:hypothetical protein
VESPAPLTDPQRRKLLVWKRLLAWTMAAAGVCALLELGLLLWPGASRGSKLTVAGILVELVVSAAVLGAAGKCPACGSRFGMEHQGLTPRRCAKCGVALA